MVREVDWNKAKVSLLCSGKQEFNRDDLFEAAAWLKIEPYEILIPPDKAMSLRRLVSDARKIAGEQTLAPVVKHDITARARKAKAGHAVKRKAVGE